MKASDQYTVFDRMLEGVQVIDHNFRYIYVNDAVAFQARIPKEELLGSKMSDKFPGIEKTQMFKQLQKSMTHHFSHVMLNEFLYENGTKGYFELLMNPVPEGVLILSVDITEQKKLENQLRHLNDNLELIVNERTRELDSALEREKKLNDIKSRFVSIASHELINPLGVIQICIEHLENPKDWEYVHEYIEMIKASTKDMKQIISDFLSLDKLEHGIVNSEMQPFDLIDILLNELKKLNFTCKQGQNIYFNHEGGKKVVLDKQIIKSIITNLISNSIKYSDKDIYLTTKINENTLFIDVEDMGIGIPQDEQKKLFTKFFRASNSMDVNGTGLGLNIVKRYVDMLRGEISFSSKINQGTIFHIKIPNFLSAKA